MTAASGFRHCDLIDLDKQSNGRRTGVESKSNRSRNYCISGSGKNSFKVVGSASRSGSSPKYNQLLPVPPKDRQNLATTF